MKTFEHRNRHMVGAFKHLAFALLLFLICAAPCHAQYLQQTGSPTFNTAEPIELGFVDASNGIVHLEIPIASAPQRGRLGFVGKLVYDSRIWQVVYNGSYTWQPSVVKNIVAGTPVSAQGGWRFISSDETGNVTENYSTQSCGGGVPPPPPPTGHEYTYGDFIWTAPDGTQHTFLIETIRISGTGCPDPDQSTGFALAQDSSGYFMSVTNYSSATVYAKDGTQVYPLVEDTNGNYLSASGNCNAGPTCTITDTLGRAMVTGIVGGVPHSITSTTGNGISPIKITLPAHGFDTGDSVIIGGVTGNTAANGTWTVTAIDANTFSIPATGNGAYTGGGTASLAGNNTVFDVLGFNSGTSPYTVTYTKIDVNTNFGQSGVTEYSSGGNSSLQIPVITNIGLPDGTSYAFTYDNGTSAGNFGLIKQITLPTGGTIIYTHTTFADSFGNKNRWVNTRAVSPGGTCTYAPVAHSTCPSSAPSGSTCQKLTVTKPSNDTTVYNFILNNGGWNGEADYYSGSSTLVMTVSNTYDFNQTGAHYIRKLTATTSLPSAGGTVTKKVVYNYDSPQNGNVTKIQEWNFGNTGANPDRQNVITYVTDSGYTTKHMIGLPNNIQIQDSGGAKIAETIIGYDSTGFNPSTAVTGMANHDDTNYGLSNLVRANPTVVQRWTGTGSTYLSTTSYFDTTGQVTKVTDPNTNPTTITYSNQNAYPYQIAALSLTTTLGYDSNTGLLTSIQDANQQTTNLGYDNMSRLTSTGYPDGGSASTTYTSATVRDVYKLLFGTTSLHGTVTLDGLGRAITSQLVSDPSGTDTVDTSYDSTGRLLCTSNPYRTAGPTCGQSGFVGDTVSYDGLSRAISVTHADTNVAHTYYGADVGSHGGTAAQLCSTSTGSGLL